MEYGIQFDLSFPTTTHNGWLEMTKIQIQMYNLAASYGDKMPHTSTEVDSVTIAFWISTYPKIKKSVMHE